MRPKLITEWILNSLTLLVVGAIATLLFMRFFATERTTSSLHTGSPFRLSKVDWKSNHRSLVLALQVGCHWCESSAGFYHELLQQNSNQSFHPIAVLPQSVQESRDFLHSLGVDVADVRHQRLSELGVGGTPTLILVDDSGRVQSSWVGRLSPQMEDQVYEQLGLTRPLSSSGGASPKQDRSVSLLTSEDLVRLKSGKEDFDLIDINPRSSFESNHIEGAINIPLYELDVRGKHEISPSRPTVLYCDYRTTCKLTSKRTALQTYSTIEPYTKSYCELGLEKLTSFGFHDVRVISDGIQTLRTNGINIVANSTKPSTTQLAYDDPYGVKGGVQK